MKVLKENVNALFLFFIYFIFVGNEKKNFLREICDRCSNSGYVRYINFGTNTLSTPTPTPPATSLKGFHQNNNRFLDRA